MAGRTGVRDTLYNFLLTPQITTLNQVFKSFPKRINYQVNSTAGQLSRSAVVIYIAGENETRLAIGGATSGWKRVDYTIILQVIDNIKTRLRSDHRFGDTTGTLVWQGAEPRITTRYGEPATSNEGATETFAEIEFDATEMIQA
jgi:hypothetical protein